MRKISIIVEVPLYCNFCPVAGLSFDGSITQCTYFVRHGAKEKAVVTIGDDKRIIPCQACREAEVKE